ncbi:MAG: hypothetical protein O9350_04015 [Microcystis sp. LE19-388.1G]|nr:hypothetical protein [Microcystis sp. LE19-388.1G]
MRQKVFRGDRVWGVRFPSLHPTPYTLFQVGRQQELPELHFLRQTTEFMSDCLMV